MNAYSHYLLAGRVEALLTPSQPAEYYWGAVAPDVRYLAGLPRAQTHRSRAELLALQDRYPQLESFIQGYRVHCLLDEIDLVGVFLGTFPLSLFRRLLRGRLTQFHAVVLAELHFLQTPHPNLPFEGGHNLVLDGLGIRAEDSRSFAAGLREYLAAPSITTGLASFERLGFIQSGRGEKYLRAARQLEKSPVLRSLLLACARGARLEQKAEQHVRGALKIR